jgi:tetratricopeptide (TPR) repeat protein
MNDKVFLDMLIGHVDPFVVASAKAKNGEVSVNTVLALHNAIVKFLQTGMLLSPDFVYTGDPSNTKKCRQIAERFARYNYHVATLINSSEDVIADVAFLLFQLIEGSPATLQERKRLFDKFYPSLACRNLQPEMLFHINYRALDLHSRLASSNKEYFQDVLRFGLEALKYSAEPATHGTEEHCQVLFWLGVSLNETGQQSAEQLNKSIGFFRQCLENKVHCQGRFLGSVLNSLGYSLLLLGRLQQDPQTLTEAITTLEMALPYRVGDHEQQLTQNNLAHARHSLAGGISEKADSSQEVVLRYVDVAFQMFKEVMADNLKGDFNSPLLKAGMEQLLEAASVAEVKDDFYLQARLELALGIGLVYSGDNATAICFLKSALRKWEKLDTPDKLPRKTAAYYNLGLAFTGTKGLSSKSAYVGKAIEHFQAAKALFAELGSVERVQICETFIQHLEKESSENAA